MRHIGTDEVFLEGIVTRRHGRMRSKQGGGSHQLKRDVEVEVVLVDVDTQTLQTAESGMALVAVEDGRLHAHGFEQADATHAEEHLLLDAHLAVAAIKSARDATVLGRVLLDVGIQEIESYPTHVDTPCLGIDRATGESDAHLHPFALVVEHRLQGQLRELLRDVFGTLLAGDGDLLCEVAVTIQQTDAHHVGVRVGGLLHIVACQDAQTAGIDLQALHQAVFHAKIGNEVLLLRRLRHVSLELVVHLI